MSARGVAYRARQDEVDEVAVLRAVMGEPPAVMTRGERVAAIAQLARRGYSDRAIADRIGITTRSVTRLRSQYGIPSRIAPGDYLPSMTAKEAVA